MAAVVHKINFKVLTESFMLPRGFDLSISLILTLNTGSVTRLDALSLMARSNKLVDEELAPVPLKDDVRFEIFKIWIQI